MSRLPTPGSDNNQWGTILNDFLQVEHNADGSLKIRSDGTLNAYYVKPGTGIPKADLAAAVQASLAKADAAPTALSQLSDVQLGALTDKQILSYDQGTGKWVASANGGVSLQSTSPGIADNGNLHISGIAKADAVATNRLYQRSPKLLFYYGTPQGVNNLWDDNKAAQVFAQYNYVVFGNGLENPGNTYNSSTTSIIAKMRALNSQVVVFGYIDLGVTSSNLSIATMQTMTDQWQTTGADGIMLDEAGYDFHVPRSRLNTMVSYIHGKGMSAFVNAFTPDDVMGSAVDATYNPSGTPTAMDNRDSYLLESWLINTSAYSSAAGYTSFFNTRPRADSALSYRSSLGVKVMAVGLVDYSAYSDEDNTKFFKMNEATALAFSLDGYGLGASPDYSASGSNANVVKFFSYDPAYPDTYAPTPYYNITNDWIEISRPDIGLTVHVDTGTTTYAYTTPETNLFDVITVNSTQDNVGVGTNSPQGRFHVHGHFTGTVTEIVQGAFAQTADLLQLQTNDTTPVAKVDVAGSPTFTGPTVSLSNNVRGIATAITNGASSVAITFATAQSDTNYAVICTPNYNTTCYVTNQTSAGFTINFGTAAGSGATVHWLVVR
ncbi:MAG TPA: hypothetical protein VHT70_02665 [Candidatus Saccharimonadales bacterium]|jgi:hypothetical protein|nr:hypothetical protein [Candidatus Saccharimonadales bacterium]